MGSLVDSGVGGIGCAFGGFGVGFAIAAPTSGDAPKSMGVRGLRSGSLGARGQVVLDYGEPPAE